MTLIKPNTATNQLNSSSINLHKIAELTQSATTEDVVTEVSLVCLDEIQKTHLTRGHAAKKFIFTSLTYAAAIALPVATLAGAVWRISAQENPYSHIVKVAGLSALLLADRAIGKVLGIRPVTAMTIAAYDAYRQAALTLSKQVQNSYTNHELQVNSQIEKHRQTIKNELITTYLGIASELAARHKKGTIKDEAQTLEEKLPIVTEAFSKIGLTNVEIADILSPLKDTMKLISTTNEPTKASEKTTNPQLITVSFSTPESTELTEGVLHNSGLKIGTIE